MAYLDTKERKQTGRVGGGNTDVTAAWACFQVTENR
jgi:hypothetical protein